MFSTREEAPPRALWKTAGCKTNTVEGDLETRLITVWQAVFSPSCAKAFGEGTLPAIYDSWRALASPLGYAPIEEVVLLASISTLGENRGFFEMADGRQVIEEARKKYPNTIRYNVDRMGRAIFMKFLKPLD